MAIEDIDLMTEEEMEEIRQRTITALKEGNVKFAGIPDDEDDYIPDSVDEEEDDE